MMSIRVLWRRIPGPGIALLREPITGHFRSGQIPGSPSYRVPGPAMFKSRDPGIHQAVHPFLVPGMVGIAMVTKEVDLKLLLFLIRTNLVQLDIILDQVLLGHVPGRGLEIIVERTSLIVIGLILETLIDGDTKDIVLDLVHKRSRRHHHIRGRKRSRDKRRRSSRSPSIQEKRSRISLSSSSDKDLVKDVISGSITDNEFEAESVASPVKKSVPNTMHRVKDKTSTHRPSENCSVYSEEEDDGKISNAETIEEVFNLLPASICPRKNESSTPSKPRSGIDLLNPSEDKESSSLPQSQLVKDILNLVQTHVSDKVKLEPGWTAPISLEKELGTHILHNEQFPASVPKVDKDASKLDLSSTGSIRVTSKFLESMERQARHVISINSYADLFATSAFSAMQSDDMDTNMLCRLVEALVNCLKHSTNLSVLMAVELMLARRELAISGSKILTDASKDSLRSVPFSADSLFGGKISEIQKANSETHQQKLIADSVSQKPGTSQSQSSQFRTPRVPIKKQDSKKDFPRPPRQFQGGRGGSRISRGGGTSRRDRTVPSRRGASSDRRHWSISSTALSSKGSSSRRTPGPFCKRVGKNISRQMGPFCRIKGEATTFLSSGNRSFPHLHSSSNSPEVLF